VKEETMRTILFLTLCAVALLILGGCPTHRLLRETPVKWNFDLVKYEGEALAELRTHLLPEGLIIYQKRPPYDAAALYAQGTRQADGAYYSGYLLAALTYKWKVTGDAETLELAKRVWDAHHKLVADSGYPGLVARSFGKTNPADPGYVFRKDGSGDGLIGWMFGTSAFVRHVDDPVRRAQAAADVKAICEHLRKHNLKIYENETTPTPYGNFKTPVFGVPIGNYAMPMCGLAALAVYLNPGDAACENFQAWILGKDYHRQTRYFYPWFPHRAFNTCTFIMSFVVAMQNDESPHRRGFYKRGADSFWERTYDWQNAFFGLCYKFGGGDNRPAYVRDSIDRLRNMPPYFDMILDEKKYTKAHAAIVPLEDRTMSSSYWTSDVFEELTKQDGPRDPIKLSRQDYLVAYWFGRFQGEYKPGEQNAQR
jgi:hypothetical protein